MIKAQPNSKRVRVIACDMDGVLCEEECWDEWEVLSATPNQRMIDKINELYNHNFIVVYTARRDHLLPATLEWLRKHGVKFHAISNNKMSADVYIDDKAIDEKTALQL